MRINRAELADLGTFLAIARHRSFRRAGLELGVSASALSHALKAMEARLGVRLVNRTSRSVTLTAAGDDLLVSLDAPFAAIGSALDVLNLRCAYGLHQPVILECYPVLGVAYLLVVTSHLHARMTECQSLKTLWLNAQMIGQDHGISKAIIRDRSIKLTKHTKVM